MSERRWVKEVMRWGGDVEVLVGFGKNYGFIDNWGTSGRLR